MGLFFFSILTLSVSFSDCLPEDYHSGREDKLVREINAQIYNR